MTEFKCKICGGTLAFDEGSTIAECEYCGTKQTLPKLTDDRRNSLYDRANHYRRNNEFDKAAGIYEQLLNEDTTDAEAYWSLVLCRYGIEYVEDPSSHKRLPTINRAQYTSIFADENYKSALQYADGGQRALYEEEAAVIDNIQKGILAISEKEEPFDVFICYKETDANGRRTHDSVLANDLYHQLVQEGFKVFFARITLEDKLGTAYEPYIFAALNSSKVMVVLGTKPEYFNAVWVKNEWSRYLGLIKSGAKKILIPAYKDMDPYDLPEEFSHLQAQDMSKLGFMQDLIRGIKKLTAVEEKPVAVIRETTVINNNGGVSSAEPMVKRAFLSLEDGEFDKADEFAEQALNIDPEYSLAYVAKLMSQLKVKTRDGLGQLKKSFEDNGNYKKAVRFGDASLKKELAGYLEEIRQRIELNNKNSVYNEACKLMAIKEIPPNEKAIKLFQSLSGFKDSEAKIHECELNIDQIKAWIEEERIRAEQRAEAERIEKARQEELSRQEAELRRIEREKQMAAIAAADRRNEYIILCVLLFILVGIVINNLIEENRVAAERARIVAQRAEQEPILAAQRAEQERILVAMRSAEAEKIIKEMVKCPAGSFEMGSPSGELGRYDNEKQHHVTISKSFYIAKYPVTQAQYKAVMGNNPSYFKGDNNPVECVSWFKAKEFCDKLNEVTGSTRPAGYKFDLPTEAQWEYACRAGTTTSLNSGKNITSEYGRCSNLDEVGWYDGNSGRTTHPVGLKKPNAWGIYDMHGNVCEWCRDRCDEYPSGSCTDPEGPDSGSYRVYRGSGWRSFPWYCRSANRCNYAPDFEDCDLGFRIALVLSSK